MLCSIEWQSFINVSGQRPDVQEEKDFLTFEDGADTLSGNICKGLSLDAA
jgi:hypothetical protein